MIMDVEERKIQINKDILCEIYKWRQTGSNDLEAGGMLIGSIIRDSNDIIIEDLTLPIEGDYRSRTSFIRCEHHNKLLEKKWADSQYTKMYFGEWHTHPQVIPNHSSQDMINWLKLMEYSKTDTNMLLYIITGIDVFKIWLGIRKSKIIRQISIGDINEFKMA